MAQDETCASASSARSIRQPARAHFGTLPQVVAARHQALVVERAVELLGVLLGLEDAIRLGGRDLGASEGEARRHLIERGYRVLAQPVEHGAAMLGETVRLHQALESTRVVTPSRWGAARLLSILMPRQTRGRMSAPVLAEGLEVLIRTLYRDIEQTVAPVRDEAK